MKYKEYNLAGKEINAKYRRKAKRSTILGLAAYFSMVVGLTGVKFYKDNEEELKEFYPIAVEKIAVEETLGKLEQAREHLENIAGSSYKNDSSQRIKGLQEKIDEEIILAKKDLESITAEPQFKRYESLIEKCSNRQNLFFGVLCLGAAAAFIPTLINSINKCKEDKELSDLRSKYELKEFMRSSLDVSGYN